MQPSQKIYRTEYPNSALPCAKGCGFLTLSTRRQQKQTVILVLGLSNMPSPSPVPQSNPLHCSKCQQKLPNVNTVLRHVAEKHLPAGRPLRAGRPRWPCVAPNCDLDFISDKDLRRHLMDIHLGIKYTCSCGRRNRRDNHLAHIQDPLRKCKSVGPYICRPISRVLVDNANAVQTT
ncbi:hypothetical protein F5883DRAFT_225614 [Diaporthe sp. PMI_573]|nr:hypothetical protein F5883DRAFT_225614 [Diaporthaceae sp. PMI_573]